MRVNASAVLDSTYAKLSRRIVWPLLVAYIIAYLDRVNVGFAKLQMLKALGFTETTYGLGAGVFFIGYFVFGVPANLMLHRLGARRWLAAIMIVWGGVSAATTFIRTPSQFYGLRFVLGVAEAGFFPGVIFYLTQWFPTARRARMTALFMTAVAISGAIGSPVSGWIMQRFDAGAGLAGWQWLFLLEALPAMAMGLYLFVRLDDGVMQASWLEEEEKQAIASAVGLELKSGIRGSLAAALREWRVWLVSIIYFCSVMGLYGIGFWLPTIIAEMGVEQPLYVGLLSAIPYLAAAIAMVLTGHSADRHQEHRWHVAVPAAIGALALIASAGLSHQRLWGMVALTIATSGLLTAPPLIWGIPTGYQRGLTAAIGIGVINSCGNLAGFASPYAVGWIKDKTGSTTVGMLLVSGFVLLSAALAILGLPRDAVETLPADAAYERQRS